MNFADKLITLRTRRGMSQEELTERLGLSRQTIGRWETAQALPETGALLALSSCFDVTIDSLLRDEPCAPRIVPDCREEDFVPFLLRAKRATYAGHGPECAPSRPGAHDFSCTEGTLSYRDSYLGGECFFGEEAVWAAGRPLWSMNYGGRTLSSAFSGDFLKRALCHGTPDLPYRGPALYREGDYTYQCSVQGDLRWFTGAEVIYYEDALIYECRFHGGKVR